MSPKYAREHMTSGIVPFSAQIADGMPMAEHLMRFERAFVRAADGHRDLAAMVHAVVGPTGLHVRPGLNGRSHNWPEPSSLSLAFGGVTKSVPGSYHCPPNNHAWIPCHGKALAIALATEIAGLGSLALASPLLQFPAPSTTTWGVVVDFSDADELDLLLSMLNTQPNEVRVWLDQQSWRWALTLA